jgi:hypothetical protein
MSLNATVLNWANYDLLASENQTLYSEIGRAICGVALNNCNLQQSYPISMQMVKKVRHVTNRH